jgi:hypothetical protein
LTLAAREIGDGFELALPFPRDRRARLSLCRLRVIGERPAFDPRRILFLRHALTDLNRLTLAPRPRAFGYSLERRVDIELCAM